MNRIVSILLILCLSLSFVSTGAFNITAFAVTSGKTGNCKWSVDGTVLTVSGNGKMGDYGNTSVSPWGTDISEVIIENGVTSIGNCAFMSCSNLASVTIADSVTTIGYAAFYECENLTSVTIPDSVTDIGTYAFMSCSRLTSVTIPDSVITIGESAFCSCIRLASVTIPNSVTTIGAYAFGWCDKLTSVIIPDSVITVGEGAFSNCGRLTSVTIGNSVTTIGTYAFLDCGSLTSVDFGNSVTTIGDYAFCSCGELTSFIIPDTVTTVGECIFSGCKNLKRTALSRKMTTVGEKAFASSDITVLYIPREVTLIKSGAFEHTDVAYVYYGGSEADKQKLIVLSNNDSLNSATWVYNATGLPDHQYDNDYDTICNLCSGKRVTLKDTSKMFNDIKVTSWYKQYVDYAVGFGIFSGTSYTTFSPDSNITRAQFVQVLANLEGVDISNNKVTTAFSDVPSRKWFTVAVKWASENNIVSGMGGGLFKPNDNVTREQMCVMLTNFAKFKSITLNTVEAKATFADDAKISKWAKTAVYTCQQADIVNGKGENKFDPQGTGTRAEASVMFTKFHKDYLVK